MVAWEGRSDGVGLLDIHLQSPDTTFGLKDPEPLLHRGIGGEGPIA
jgi:hypothetical protein